MIIILIESIKSIKGNLIKVNPPPLNLDGVNNPGQLSHEKDRDITQRVTNS
jgi:hypothetical protein